MRSAYHPSINFNAATRSSSSLSGASSGTIHSCRVRGCGDAVEIMCYTMVIRVNTGRMYRTNFVNCQRRVERLDVMAVKLSQYKARNIDEIDLNHKLLRRALVCSAPSPAFKVPPWSRQGIFQVRIDRVVCLRSRCEQRKQAQIKGFSFRFRLAMKGWRGVALLPCCSVYWSALTALDDALDISIIPKAAIG